ncbi:uncharacterized protein VTP21DRAFT_3424 [Calcarisporiella thermophila]|uniref:uncharacterized protein n=1 Tax=Calcarisporiella thermophila TaxID=911321 RepID=UPI0037448575
MSSGASVPFSKLLRYLGIHFPAFLASRNPKTQNLKPSSMRTSLFTLCALASTALATMVEVKVGDGGLKFNPPNAQAKVGDMVMFTWVKGMHSVTQAQKVDSCDPMAGGFDSDVHGAGFSFNLTLEEKHVGDVGFFCKVGKHCQNGMKGVLKVSKADGSGGSGGSSNGSTNTNTNGNGNTNSNSNGEKKKKKKCKAKKKL